MKSGDYDERTRAAKFLSENTEIQNIKSTLEVATSWATKEVRRDMAKSGGIDFRECKKRPMTIYFIVPTNEMKAKASYTRMALSDCLRALYNHDGIPTTVIIEEAFVLGYHEEIEQASINTSWLWVSTHCYFPELPANQKIVPRYAWSVYRWRCAGVAAGFAGRCKMARRAGREGHRPGIERCRSFAPE